MTISIGQQISALKTQRNLQGHTEALGRSYERLSTGMRINKASDDAAGLSISESLRVDTRIGLQALRNANDGISVTHIMDSALGELVNIATRISELAEQSANGVYSVVQRSALQIEALQLSNEHGRIVNTTTFNNRKLFDTSNGEWRIQIGKGLPNSIALDPVKVPDAIDFSGSASVSASGDVGVESSTGTGIFTAKAPISSMGDGQLAVGDLNGDGKADVVVADADLARFYVAMGNGDGTFQASTFAAGTDRANALALVDVNGDSKLDLVTAYNNTQHGVNVLLGNGNGTFQAATSIGLVEAKDLVVADVSGDGKMDILTGSTAGGNTVRLLKGNGDGTFQAVQSFTVAAGPMALAVGDLNNDGKQDVVTANASAGGVSILIGTGGGNFAASSNIGGPAEKFLSLGDVNGDNKLDILSGENGNRFSIRFGNGDGTVAARTEYLGEVGDFPIMTATDMNGDGKSDLVLSSLDNDFIRTYFSNGASLVKSQDFAVTDANKPVVADLTGDGVNDIIASDQWDNLHVYIQGATVTPPATPTTGDVTIKGDLTTASASRLTLDGARSLQDSLIGTRGIIGAFESRLTVAVSDLLCKSVLTAQADSRIRDVDVAEEAANMTRNSILSQISADMLKMTTRGSEIALSLLQG